MKKELDEIKRFMLLSAEDLVDNPFTKIEHSLVSDISEKRFYSYLDSISEKLGVVLPPITGIEEVIQYLENIEKKANLQFSKILENERNKVVYHLAGRRKKIPEAIEMELVSSNGWTYSENDNGWIFK